MNVFADLRARIIDALRSLEPKTDDDGDLDFSKIATEPPRDSVHGDVASNAAMVLAKPFGSNPRALAERIAGILETDADIKTVTVAGPGFVNLKLSRTFWVSHLKSLLDSGAAYGRSKVGAGRRINVEYVSANPTGPMHVGHCRGAVVGDALANLLSFAGADVTREYYINDAGVQIDILARSVWRRYREALGDAVGDIPEGLYPGEYLVPVGASLVEEFGESLKDKPEREALRIVADRTIDAMMSMIRADLDTLNVHHDVFFSERSLYADNAAAIDGAIASLENAGHVYRGKLPPPKGRKPDDWEDREQLLFRSTDAGDDMDRPLRKSDGSHTYFASDVAYLKHKLDCGFDQTIFVLGADHSGYVKRMEALNAALSGGSSELTVILCNLVKLFRDGEPVRMSKRAGEFVTLREAVDEVGRDPVRFMMLFRKNMEPLDFDFAKVTEQSKDNPVFYVQYASARCHSVFRRARERFGADLPDSGEMSASLHLLTDDGELGLIRKLSEYPRIIEAAAQTLEPHRIAFYLYDLASAFHAHWNRGNETTGLRFVKANDPELTHARLGLARAVSNVLTSGLGLIGAEAPHEMR